MSDFGKDKQYWIERAEKTVNEQDLILCSAMIENFELKEKISELQNDVLMAEAAIPQ